MHIYNAKKTRFIFRKRLYLRQTKFRSPTSKPNGKKKMVTLEAGQKSCQSTKMLLYKNVIFFQKDPNLFLLHAVYLLMLKKMLNGKIVYFSKDVIF